MNPSSSIIYPTEIESLRQQLAVAESGLEAEKKVASRSENEAFQCAYKLADRIKREAMLRKFVVDAKQAFDGVEVDSRWFDRGMVILDEALAATADLDGLILCYAEPVAQLYDFLDDKEALLPEEVVQEQIKAYPQAYTPLYRAWEPNQ